MVNWEVKIRLLLREYMKSALVCQGKRGHNIWVICWIVDLIWFGKPFFKRLPTALCEAGKIAAFRRECFLMPSNSSLISINDAYEKILHEILSNPCKIRVILQSIIVSAIAPGSNNEQCTILINPHNLNGAWLRVSAMDTVSSNFLRQNK